MRWGRRLFSDRVMMMLLQSRHIPRCSWRMVGLFSVSVMMMWVLQSRHIPGCSWRMVGLFSVSVMMMWVLQSRHIPGCSWRMVGLFSVSVMMVWILQFRRNCRWPSLVGRPWPATTPSTTHENLGGRDGFTWTEWQQVRCQVGLILIRIKTSRLAYYSVWFYLGKQNCERQYTWVWFILG